MTRVALWLVVVMTMLASNLASVSVTHAASCQFELGFKVLHDAIPDTVGQCLDNRRNTPSGDKVQHTTHGLLVWRKADSVSAFTDGSFSWMIGPDGLVKRRNSERFRWETLPGTRDNPVPVGDTADIGAGLTLSVLHVSRDTGWMDPSELAAITGSGYQLVLAAVRVTNGGPGSNHLLGQTGFRAANLQPETDDYAPAGSVCGVYPDPLPAADIPPGGGISGTICFAVAAEDVNGLELYYRNPSPQEGRLYFWLVPAA